MIEEEIQNLKACIATMLDAIEGLLARVVKLEEKTQERAFNED